MSVFPNKSPSGKVTWTAEIRLADYPWHRKKGFRTKTEAKEYKANYIAKLNNNEAVVSNKLKLGDFLETWLKEAQSERNYSDSTHLKYFTLLKVVKPIIGHIKITHLKSSHILNMRNKLKATHKPSYINSIETMIKGALADKEKDIGLSPLRQMKGMRKDEKLGIKGDLKSELNDRKKPIKWFEPWEQEKLLQTAWEYALGERSVNLKIKPEKNLIPYMLIYLGLHSGARRGELHALTWDRIDFQNKTILIDRTIEYSQGDTKGRFTTTKTDEDRTIRINDDNVDQLKRYRLWVKEKLLPLRKDINEIPVFFASDFGILHSTQPNKVFSTIVRQAGLKHRRFHDLRHTHASNLISEEIYPPKIQKRLGHAKLETTMKIYAHFFNINDDKLDIALDNIGVRLRGRLA